MSDNNGAGLFCLGLGIGVATAFLLTPKSGAESRQYLKDRANEGADYLKTKADESTDYLKRQGDELAKTATTVAKNASDALDRGAKTVRHHKENVMSAVNAGREALERGCCDHAREQLRTLNRNSERRPLMAKNTAVFRLCPSRDAVESAVMAFQNAGYRPTDISLLLPENIGNKDLSMQKNTKGPEGAATGAVSGAVVGGALGWLVGIGALAIPGLGPFIAAGPIMAALAGMGAGGTVGGIGGALVGLGIPEYEAKRYEGRIHQGGILLSIHCDSSEWTARAKKMMEVTGAQDISSTSEAGADYATTERPVVR